MASGELTITGGIHSGKKLRTPGNHKIRPLRSRVRRALFDLLGSFVEDATVLDSFAGTGALGFEALSRGAEYSLFLDRSPEAIQIIERNAGELGVLSTCEWRQVDLLETPTREMDGGRQFQLVFVTPPYRFFQEAEPRRKLNEKMANWVRERLVGTGGIVVVEYRTGDSPGKPPEGLERTEQREFGNTSFQILRRYDG